MTRIQFWRACSLVICCALSAVAFAFDTTIQAESYAQMSGIQTETTTDVGGGLNVGWIDNGDWMTYNVNIPTAGSYKVSYRVASLSGGGVLQLENAGGNPVYGKVSVSSTGGWQTWMTVTQIVNLPAGQQTLGVAAVIGGWNLNWFRIESNESPGSFSSNGVYTIKSKFSGKLIEVGSALTNDNANINLWSSNGNPTQSWLITHISGNDYSIINTNSGKAMEVYNSATFDGANVSQYEYWGGTQQIWTIVSRGSGYYSIINKNSGKALDVLGWSNYDGANIGQWSYGGSDNQLWSFSTVVLSGDAPLDTSTTNGATNHWQLSGNLVTHDPTLTWDANKFYVYQTGPGILGKVSSNGSYWEGLPAVFPNGLYWWKTYVPNQSGIDVWAPDVKWYNGKFWMYYSISTFGSKVSAIGLASTSSLASNSWADKGLVISTNDTNDYNAIDPDLVIDKDGQPWLVFGSWNSGIKIVRLNPVTMKPMGIIHSIAARSGGIEAPTMIYRQGYYYLFVSIGVCCAGVNSTYRIAYGRSTSVTGPFYDKGGNNMLSGGGTIFDSGNSVWIGPGGEDILNTDVIVRHAYDATDGGVPKLLISTLNWDSNGWPKY